MGACQYRRMPTKTGTERGEPDSPRHGYATVDEVAAYLGIAKQTVYGWRKRGFGPKATKVGRLVRYSWADLEKWAAEQTAA